MNSISMVEKENRLAIDGTYSFSIVLGSAKTEDFGGIYAVIHYDQNCFRFKSAVAPESILRENYTEDATNLCRAIEDKNDWVDLDGDNDGISNIPGELRFVMLGDNMTEDTTTTEIITFTFDLVGIPGTKSSFTFGKIDLCNWDEDWVELTARNELDADLSNLDVIDLSGSTIKVYGIDDIAFGAVINTEKLLNVEEAGFIIVPTEVLNSEDVLELNRKYSGEDATVVRAPYAELINTIDTVRQRQEFKATIKSVSNTDNRAGIDYQARAFIRFKDGTVIYSKNENSSVNVISGEVSRSHDAIAQLIQN